MVTGKVQAFASINPRYARLFGPADKTVKTQVTITPDMKYPFKIVNLRAKNGQNIKYEIAESDKSGVKGYVLTIENVKKEKGRYSDTIYLDTDSSIKKELRVTVYGNITAAVKGS